MNDENEWRIITKQKTFDCHRTGWFGVWDAVMSAFTGNKRLTITTDFTFSVWVKGDKDVEIVIYNARVEELM